MKAVYTPRLSFGFCSLLVSFSGCIHVCYNCVVNYLVLVYIAVQVLCL